MLVIQKNSFQAWWLRNGLILKVINAVNIIRDNIINLSKCIMTLFDNLNCCLSPESRAQKDIHNAIERLLRKQKRDARRIFVNNYGINLVELPYRPIKISNAYFLWSLGIIFSILFSLKLFSLKLLFACQCYINKLTIFEISKKSYYFWVAYERIIPNLVG